MADAGSASAIRVGVVTWVLLSEEELPVSLVANMSREEGTVGAVVSTLIVMAADSGPGPLLY